MANVKKLETPPTKQVVELLQKLLAQAEAGELRGIAYAAVTDDDSVQVDYRCAHHGDISRIPTGLRICTQMIDDEILCFSRVRGNRGQTIDEPV